MNCPHCPACFSSRVGELRTALMPFSRLGGSNDGVRPAYHDCPDDLVLYANSGHGITAGDVRSARRALGLLHAPGWSSFREDAKDHRCSGTKEGCQTMDGVLISGGAAIISDCGTYRYVLSRRLTAGERVALFIMLNPSTADADQDDPTIRRCIGFTRAMGLDVLKVVNLFAFRATSPRDLLKAAQPIGPDNDKHIDACAEEIAHRGGRVICAWGANGDYLGRDGAVMRRLLAAGLDPHALGETSKNMPRHPLYLKGDCRPLPYRRS